MDEPQLLIEHWGQPTEITDIVASQINESSSTKKPGLYIEGIFLQAEVVNRNKRLYPKKILEKAIDRYITEQVKTSQALGELNHPPRAMVDPMQAAIIIELSKVIMVLVINWQQTSEQDGSQVYHHED